MHTVGIKWTDLKKLKQYGFVIKLPDFVPAYCQIIQKVTEDFESTELGSQDESDFLLSEDGSGPIQAFDLDHFKPHIRKYDPSTET